MEKECSTCHLLKEINLFNKKSNGRYGVDSKCKSCVSQYKKKQYRKKQLLESKSIEIQKADFSLSLADEQEFLFDFLKCIGGY